MTYDLQKLFLDLVSIKSVVSSTGELEIIDFLENHLRSWDYFKKNPKHLKRIKASADPLGRSSLLVVVSGQKSPDTVVLLGHTDTVEVDDYGPLQQLATKPEELKQALRQGARDLYPQALQDLKTEDFHWGRGCLDMKAGVANEIHLLRKLSENPASFKGHVLALFVCDEEGNSAGMISAVEALKKWRDENRAKILGVINTDYHTAQYPGDKAYYLFRGTVGKIMPAFYVRTVETHAGDPFAGLDANFVLAELISRINLNPSYSDSYAGEFSVPPISLKMTDLKEVYSVKTNHEAWTLISVPLFGKTPVVVLEEMKIAAREAVDSFLEKFYANQDIYAREAGLPTKNQFLPFEIISLAELVEKCARQEKTTEAELLSRSWQKLENISDSREQTLQLMRDLELLLPDRRPRIVIGFAPPFYPAISFDLFDCEFYKNIDRALKKTSLAPVAAKDSSDQKEMISCTYSLASGKELKVRTFYPYISDLSYLALPYSDSDLKALTVNMPALDRSYKMPLETMRDLNCPVINLGAYGFDAHKWTERVEIDYSFNLLPELLEGIVTELLQL